MTIVFDKYKIDNCDRCLMQPKCCCTYPEMIMCSIHSFYKDKSQREECKNDPEYSDIDIKRMKKYRDDTHF